MNRPALYPYLVPTISTVWGILAAVATVLVLAYSGALTGPQGAPGRPGEAGPVGPQGARGPSGATGTLAVCVETDYVDGLGPITRTIDQPWRDGDAVTCPGGGILVRTIPTNQ